jgi:predicted metal-dependent hydrolase
MSSRPEQITVGDVNVSVIWSAQRQKTVSLEVVGGRYILRAPDSVGVDEVRRLADRLVERMAKRRHSKALNNDGTLRRRADELNQRYFDGTLRLAAIRYVTNQHRCYGSCTPSKGFIRISDKVASLPEWVRDYILVHELAHLQEGNHGPAFWRLVNRYPLAERARGYLMALEMEEGGGTDADDGPTVDGTGVV